MNRYSILWTGWQLAERLISQSEDHERFIHRREIISAHNLQQKPCLEILCLRLGLHPFLFLLTIPLIMLLLLQSIMYQLPFFIFPSFHATAAVIISVFI